MSIALTVKHLLACGASHEAVVKAVEEIEASSEAAHAAKRERNRDRMRASRASCACTKRTTPPPSSSPTPPITTPTPDLANAKSVKTPFPESLFEDFWAAYPRKVGKGEARKAFRNALKRATPEEIIAGAKRYAASKPDPEYTKHPGPWLNADRWADEPLRKPTRTVLSGPWKPVVPEKELPKISEEERQANLRKLRGALKQSIDMEAPRNEAGAK